MRRRLPMPVVVDHDLRGVALPLSGKSVATGSGTLPRGSVSPVTGQLLRFFTYWRETQDRTDFDLSALMFDRSYRHPAWLSYTNLRGFGGTHSGDITEAPDGASEFIDLDLTRTTADVVIPQVNIFCGEGFDDVAESFFGFMLRDQAQEGRPFEPRTVRLKSELRGAGRVALPMAFIRCADGWRAVWLHLHLSGNPEFNQVENNRATTRDVVRAILDRRYLTLGYLADLSGSPEHGEPVTYVGVDKPADLPPGSVVVTPANLGDLIPR